MMKLFKYQLIGHIDGLVQDCSNSSALAMELLQSCTKPSIYSPLLLSIFQKVLSTVTPFGLELVKGPHDIHQVECLRLVLSRLDPDLAADVTPESEEFKLLQAALATKNRDIQIMALGQVSYLQSNHESTSNMVICQSLASTFSDKDICCLQEVSC